MTTTKAIGMNIMEAMPSMDSVKNAVVKAYWGANVMLGSAMLATQVAGATGTGDIWDRIRSALQDFYSDLLGIVTLVAVVCAVIALVIRMYSKNQRAIEDANAWLKRIAISWFIIAIMGTIVIWGGSLVKGAGWGQDVSTSYDG